MTGLFGFTISGLGQSTKTQASPPFFPSIIGSGIYVLKKSFKLSTISARFDKSSKCNLAIDVKLFSMFDC